ncbi:hypothetical protein EDB92DRAFT_1835405 [Lactarius akahatsu]|uniref:Uncharacterized protein n=1 Tax=Lactarius akahatsu TaxID=416441 RepID=A0AAD4QGX3_9AGAM|nr:hypothetical protein EDB92DRAFT_1835405 [Lactarius akahatsu]
MTTPFEFNAMRASLDQDLAARTLTALQKAQYQHLKGLVDGGKEGWVEIVVVPSGGVRGLRKAYMTGVAIQQVGGFSFPINPMSHWFPPLTRPAMACLWNRFGRQLSAIRDVAPISALTSI